MDRCSWVEVHDGILFNKWYLLDPKKAYAIRLLRNGQYQNFWVNGKALTFSCIISVDPCCDESCNQVEIARAKFMEAQEHKHNLKSELKIV